MKRAPITLDLVPVESEVLSAEAFLRLVKENPTAVKSSQVVPPRPGVRSFGSFVVRYTHPQYRVPA